MLERMWLILIFVLGGLVPPMYAARTVSAAESGMPCAMACCAGGCECAQCPCAGGDELPRPGEPAVPVQPEREQKRTPEPATNFSDLLGEVAHQPLRPKRAREASEARWPVQGRLESVFCVWRI